MKIKKLDDAIFLKFLKFNKLMIKSMHALWNDSCIAKLVSMTIMLFVAAGCSTSIPAQQDLKPKTVPISSVQYLIQPGDQMDIKFYNAQELNESVVVRPDGRISLELAHDIQAAGLTSKALSNSIAKAYISELNNPKITVVMKTFAGQRVFVQGEVNKPDLIALSPNMTLLQSIAVAGGLKESAHAEDVILIRRDATGKRGVFRINVSNLLNGTGSDDDITLAPFDIVYIPKTTISKINVWVDKYLRQNLPVSFSIAYGINY